MGRCGHQGGLLKRPLKWREEVRRRRTGLDLESAKGKNGDTWLEGHLDCLATAKAV